MKAPALVAHRGYPQHYPENTLIGFEAALAAGVRHLETDVQLTADQVPVLFHDRTLARLCGVPGAIHDFTAEQLRQCPARDFERFGYRFANEPIPTLSAFVDLLARHPEVTAFVEVKRIAVHRFGSAVVLNRVLRDLKPVLRQCVLISYSLETMLHARRQGWSRLGIVIDRWRERTQPIVREIQPEYLFCSIEGLPRFGRLAFEQAQIVVFEVAAADVAMRLARRGVPLIESFAVGELQPQLELLRTQ